jgi:malonyl-CoA O-methyltransferase
MADQPPVDARALARVLHRMARGDGAPWLHQEVARRMAERLPLIREAPASWLDWWGFLGGGADAVKAALPLARRIVVEPTPVLVERSRGLQRRPWWSLRRPEADTVYLESELGAGEAGLLWANMVLHASPAPAETLARWQAAIAPGGYLMFSTLGPDSLRELRSLYADAGWPVPHPPFADMHDIGDGLVHAGFADPVMDQETLRLSWSSPQALLAELRSLGGHLGRDRHPGLRTPRWQARLVDALAARADAAGRIGMSFEIVYGHAFKGAPRPVPGAPVAVPLAELRAALVSRRGKPGAS